jgi:hypothetical protein
MGRKGFDRHLALQSRVACAINLTMPPWPIGATISYGPSLVPGCSVTWGIRPIVRGAARKINRRAR